MKKKAVLFALLALLLAVVAPLAAAQEEVVVSLWSDGDTTILPGQVAVAGAGWGACNKGLVHAFINASSIELFLDGEPLLTADEAADLWGAVEPASFAGDACIQKPKPHSAEWRYVLEGLESGSHELRSIITVTRPVHDGGDYNGDGKPDMFTPGNFYNERVNTITVP